jgi:uncharacterized protein YegP (UPF0339 family)
MNPMRFKIKPARGGYRVIYQNVLNGKTIFWTQVYKTLRDAQFAVTLTKTYAAGATTKVERRKAA